MSDPDFRHDEAIARHARRFRTLGLILMVLGVLAILFPLFASIAIKVMIGWFLLLTGGAVFFYAFQTRDWSSAIFSGLVGVLHLAAGVYLAFFPLTGLIGLTVLLAIVFLIQGGFETAIGLRTRPMRGWGWLVASGIAAGVVGLLLLIGLPGTASWAIGLLVGINFLTSGVSFWALSRAVQ
ncbi:HdeD family acid-resistance protein [Octadecabacter sp. R77987]|uniref:HdeD family acid-resistance protein n=1 Tax=Octadecabacter sp. R77987 TaxID=3093874 RepID=UPI00367345BF